MNDSSTPPRPEGGQPEATIETKVMAARLGRRTKTPFLQQIAGAGAPKKFALNKAELVIGRDETADLTLPSANVSRRHARIQCRQQEVSIHDFESRNGIFLNGIKVHSAVLRDGDLIQLADVLFEFYEV